MTYDEEKIIAFMIRDLYEYVSDREYYGIITYLPDPMREHYITELYCVDPVHGSPNNIREDSWYGYGQGKTRGEAMLHCLANLVAKAKE